MAHVPDYRNKKQVDHFDVVLLTEVNNLRWLEHTLCLFYDYNIKVYDINVEDFSDKTGN